MCNNKEEFVAKLEERKRRKEREVAEFSPFMDANLEPIDGVLNTTP
jgi:hypothetical protein